MLKTAPARLLLLTAMSLGCVFTSRPQLPIADGAVEFDAVYDSPVATFDAPMPPVDADRVADVASPFDAGAVTPGADASSDISADAPTETDQCLAPVRSPDAGGDVEDAGFFNARGEPCDPTTYDASVDIGDASDVRDAGDASDAHTTDTADASEAGR